MEKIKLLSEKLINKIAAGEVLERPASAVKELIENSLDAKATKIDVFIRDGGKTEIKIVDNGNGISNEELPLSVKRHATSKLTDDNLFSIKTLGFRGEALPSIASVSKFKIISKTNSDNVGSEIYISAGELVHNKLSNRPTGTTVIVKDIFFSTPARLKFLKSEKYENILIKKTIQKLALANTEVEFNLFSEDKNIIATKPIKKSTKSDLLKKRVIDLFGEIFEKNLILFEQKRDNFIFTGLISLPTFHFSNSTNQFFFVNNRSIGDKQLHGIMKAAYRDFLSHDRFPQVIIFIETFHEDIDVNVHPTKNEVRFKDSNILRSSLISSIRATLSMAGHRATTTNSIRAIESFKVNTQSHQINFQSSQIKENEIIEENKSNVDDSLKRNSNKNSHDIPDIDLPLGYAKCQYHETYIISETNDGIVIVDQHAAHERIVYEKLKKDFFKKNIQTQILLIPEIINVDPLTLDLLSTFQAILKNYGLIIEKFGKDSILVREVPLILSNSNIKQLVIDTINELNEIGNTEIIETNINKICSSMACHGSIRAGREMKIEEMNNLLRDMELTPFSGQCNHGRPTYVELKINDIEKLFGRK